MFSLGFGFSETSDGPATHGERGAPYCCGFGCGEFTPYQETISMPTRLRFSQYGPHARIGALSVVAVICCSFGATQAHADRTLLFADDFHILTRPGTERAVHPPARHPQNPVIGETKPWEQAIGYCSVHRDKTSGRYQLWYQAYQTKAEKNTHRCVVAYAESADGIHWVKPDLGLHEFNGQQDTNIVLIGNGGRSVNYGAAVLYDSNDPNAKRRYKMAYWDFPAPETVERGGNPAPGLFVAFSGDGIHWTKYTDVALSRADYGSPGQPPLAGDASDPTFVRPAISDVIDVMYDPPRQKFVIYAKTWIDGPDGRQFWKRAVVRIESTDFTNWSQPELVMAPDARDAGQIHGAPVFYRHGLYFALVQTLDFGGFDSGGTGNMPGELAVSRDGFHWRRAFRDSPFLPVPGDASAFDAGCLWTNAMPVIEGDEIRFYYGAYPSWGSDLNTAQTGIGLAVAPLDRFVGLRTVADTGQITLQPIALDDVEALTVNTAGGAVRVEVLNVSGERMPGFTRDDAIAIEGDALRGVASWKEKSLRDLPPGHYMIRLHLKRAEVFAVSLKG